MSANQSPVTDPDRSRLPVADRRQVLRAVWRLLAADRTVFVVVLALYLVGAAAGAAGPVLLGTVVDGISAEWTPGRIDVICGAILGCLLAQALLVRYSRRMGYRLGERAAARLRESFVSRVLRLPLGQVERAGTGDLATRTSVDVAAVADLLRRTGPDVVVAVAEVVVVVAVAFTVNPVLGLLMLTGSPVLLLGMWHYLRRSERVFLAERAAGSEIAETLTASTAGARTVSGYRMQQERSAETGQRAAAHYRRLRRVLRLQSAFFPAVDLTFLIPATVICGLGGWWYLSGGPVSVGEIVAVVMLAIRLDSPLFGIMMSVNGFQDGAAALARVEGVRALPRQRLGAGPDDARVVLKNVTFGYGDGPDVLHDLSLSLEPGERLAIVGQSGAGKSTIARLVAGIDRPRSGSATVGGVSAADIDPVELRRRIVLVDQDHHVFTATLRENLTLAAPEAQDDRLWSVLASVGASWAVELSGGLDTVLGPDHCDLDVARTQQLALARVMLADPEVVILDEATVGITPTEAGGAEAALTAALHGRAVITIAHQMQAARAADRILVVADGRIVESGNHAELLSANGGYARLWWTWSGGAESEEPTRR